MQIYRYWVSLFGFGMVLVLSGGSVSSTWAQRAGTAALGSSHRVAGVVFAQGGLSVDVQDEDFGAIFRDIASQAQIDVSNLNGLPSRRISTQFTDLPLVEGLKRLLRVAGVSGYALITAHTEDGVKIERILFLDANASAGARPRAAAEPRAATRSERTRSRTTVRTPTGER